MAAEEDKEKEEVARGRSMMRGLRRVGRSIGIGIGIAIEFVRLIDEPFPRTNHASQSSPSSTGRGVGFQGPPGWMIFRSGPSIGAADRVVARQ